MNLNAMNAKIAQLKGQHAVSLAMGFDPGKSATTHRKYRKLAAQQQRELIETRAEREEFIDSQRAKRGLKPRVKPELPTARRNRIRAQ